MLTQRTFSFPAPFNAAEKGCKIINGTRIYYEAKGEGQPLVFIHGFALDNRVWEDQFHYFSRWYHCIRYDIRGYGQSALPGPQPYLSQEDLKSLLFSLGINEPVILVAHARGATIACNFALQYPRFSRALVLANPLVEGYPFASFGFNGIFNYAQTKGIEFAKRKLFLLDLFSPAKKNKQVAACLEQMIQSYSGWHFVEETAPFPSPDPACWESLSRIEIPCLLFTGELVPVEIKQLAEDLLAKLTTARRVLLNDTGFLANMESPMVFNRELKLFLNDLPVHELK